MRGVAIFLGCFALVWAVTLMPQDCWSIIAPREGVVASLARVAAATASVSLLVLSIAAPRSRSTRLALSSLVLPAMLMLLLDVICFYAALIKHQLRASIPIPTSMLWLTVLSGLLVAFARNAAPIVNTRRAWRRGIIGFVAAAATLPVALILFSGTIDRGGSADWAVAFGALVHPSGRLSDALADRTLTACELYLDGRATRLIFSGGPDRAIITEPQAMRKLAIGRQVPDSAIVIDGIGLNTRATVANVKTMLQSLPAGAPQPRIIAVSDFYHLPRVRLAFAQAGIDVDTVPAKERALPRKLPLDIAREIIGWWAYLLPGPV